MQKFLIYGLVFLFSIKSFCLDNPHWETLVFPDDTWKYFPGTEDPGGEWYQSAYSDSAWYIGQGGFGYGDGDDNTILNPVIACFFRKSFIIVDTSVVNSVLLHLDYDDGFVAYLNGQEIARDGLVGEPPTFDEMASNHEAIMYSGGTPSAFPIPKKILLLNENLLAIEVHNSSGGSSDFTAIPYFSVEINDSVLQYRSMPEWFKTPMEFKGSNLPLVIIDTEGRSIPDEPKVEAQMKIIDYADGVNDITREANVYNGYIGIEIRGSYSAGLPQKPYGIETRDSLGQNNNISLFGMPKENDWVLLTHYNEKTFARNPLSFHLFNEMGHYAPRTRLCEVTVNGSYDGIYLFSEKIKRDDGRVDIARLDEDDNAGDSITGGYIFKIDYFDNNNSWTGNYSPIDYPGSQVNFVYHDPKPSELSAAQKNYIQDYVNTFEDALYGWNFDESNGYAKFIDVKSFIDYFIIGELSRNVDAYKKSKYYYKHKINKGGLIHSGPVWDFDWAWLYLTDGCKHFGNTDGSGWAYRIDECSPWPTPDGWIVRLMQDPVFVDKVYTRYFLLREGVLSKTYINHYIDSIADLVSVAQQRHYERWDILGRDVGAGEHGPIPDTYQGEVDRLKEWIGKRIDWLDDNMPGQLYEVSTQQFTSAFSEIEVRLFPNPANSYVYIESENLINTIKVMSLTGQVVKSLSFSPLNLIKVDISDLQKGVYLVQTISAKGKDSQRLIVH